MPLPMRTVVNELLVKNDRATKIYEAVHRAWDRAVELYPQRAVWLRKATFRGIVWEHVVRELNSLASADPGIAPLFHRDTASFIIDNVILFRFKHASVSLATANYPTPEAVAYDDHEMDLYGYEGLQRVELCYVLNEFETEVIWVGISARNNGEFLWKIELTSDGIAIPMQPEFFNDDEFDPLRIASFKQPKSDEAEQNKDKKKKDNGSS
ncbi:hypothetical protein [Rhizobium grahamii]|uniref:Uncharacterized protein n=1 Tax=Rhizobium grahamii CCGE 502 TaxID=990285 RepID=S3HBU1_9HYPH|nr:hypothetical protein [Rhizobium grahamii]EPE95690.1 hypothetical protein RGCCGE502_22610 [Rhizobium grahamii CCGE 502]